MRLFTALAALPGLLLPAAVLAQSVGINTTTASPPSSAAALDVRASGTAKGVAFPSVSLASATDATTVATPPAGLMVYNTSTAMPCGAGLYFNNGTAAAPAWLCFTKQVQTFHAYDTGGYTPTATGTYTQQPGCSITITVPTGQVADIKVDATVGARVTDSGSTAHTTIDANIRLDGGFLAQGGLTRFTLENSVYAYAQGSTTLTTWITGVMAGTHTVRLYTAQTDGSTQVRIGNNAAASTVSASVNAGEIHASVYYR